MAGDRGGSVRRVQAVFDGHNDVLTKAEATAIARRREEGRTATGKILKREARLP
jgi:hypothetical protein